MTVKSNRKRELDKIRNEWRKKHRILKGKVIIWPDKPPEHINARANKTYNWFWKKILLTLNQHDIPAIITHLKGKIDAEEDTGKIRTYRTMIGMAEDAYQLKDLEDIMDIDKDILMDNKPIYNSETGIIYKDGKMYTSDFTEDESEILIRDIEGIVVNRLVSENGSKEPLKTKRSNNYQNWDYIKEN
jgi:hypothetical protein